MYLIMKLHTFGSEMLLINVCVVAVLLLGSVQFVKQVASSGSSSSSSNYKIISSMSGASLLDYFNFFTGDDPTHGYVNYVDKNVAQLNNYTSILSNGNVYLGVDHTRVVANSARGRDSIRLEGKQNYSTGLFLFDLDHMPTGCGTWPAFWTCGDDWPNQGEIDIIEQVHTATVNTHTLHTNEGCSMASVDPNSFSGTWSATTNCNVYETANVGCGIDGLPNSFGAPFNSNQGGIYAMEWTPSYIQVFYFNRQQLPADIYSESPSPSAWGKPVAFWSLNDSTCSSSHFKEHNIVINTAFCGDWAGNTFTGTCASVSSGQSCNDYVQNNPSAFAESYWSIRSLRVFQVAT